MEQVRVRLSHRERVMLERVAALLRLNMSGTVRELVRQEAQRLGCWPIEGQKVYSLLHDKPNPQPLCKAKSSKGKPNE